MLLCLLNCLACLLNGLACLLGWLLLLRVVLRVLLGPAGADDLHARALAWTMSRFQAQQEEHLRNIKQTFFQPLKEMKSFGSKRKDGALDILEVGVGCGTNLEHYPAGSALTCVDPNPHFRKHFERACADKAAHLSPDVRFAVGVGERMSAVEDSSVDVVVVTLVLCSVDYVPGVVREAYRVLRPGGKFFYLEHIAYEEGTMLRRVQNLLTHSGLWPFLLACWLNRDPSEAIRASPFRSVEQQAQPIIAQLPPWSPMRVNNRCLTGVATK